MPRMNGKAGMINSAQADINTGRQTKSKVNTGSVGKETPVSPRVVQEGGSMAEAKGLRGAIGELKSQHPQRHDDLGPHHGTSDHMRHQAHPYGGRK